MELKTFAAWASFLLSVGAGALTQSPQYSFLSMPLATASGSVFVLISAFFLISHRHRILIKITGPARMIALGLAIIFIGAAIAAVGVYQLRTPTIVVDAAASTPSGMIGSPLALASGPGTQGAEMNGQPMIAYLHLTAQNIGPKEIILKYARIISGATGQVMPLLVMADVGHIRAEEANAIPPGAMFAFSTDFGKGKDGISGDELLRDWSPLTFEVSYDDKSERIVVDKAYLLKHIDAYRPNPQPRVTKKLNQ